MDHIKTKMINGAKYTFMPLPFNPANRVYRKLHKYVAPVFGRIVEMIAPELARANKGDDKSLLEAVITRLEKDGSGAQGIAAVIEHIGELIADDDFTALMEETFEVIQCNGVALPPNHFSPKGADGGGRLGDYDQVVMWSVWYNFGQVFLEGFGTFGTAVAKLASQPPTP